MNGSSQRNIRISKVETLSDDWYVLKKTTFEFLRSDGTSLYLTKDLALARESGEIPDIAKRVFHARRTFLKRTV